MVLGGDNLTPSDFRLANIYGTAFPIGGEYFLTADHVLKNALKNPYCGLGFAGLNRQLSSRSLIAHESFPDYDVALLQGYAPDTPLLSWDLTNQDPFADVQTMGYPLAWDVKQSEIYTRAFKGHIVTTRRWHDLKAAPNIYELSFQAPPGLSGAPLVSIAYPPQLVGMIIKDTTSQMGLPTSIITEKSSDGTQTITEIQEAFHLGIALTSGVLASIHSELLGGSLATRLRRAGLLPEERA
jgi:hypothetical protein